MAMGLIQRIAAVGLVLLSAKQASAQVSACADEGKKCTLPTEDRYSIRYGDNIDGIAVFEVEGLKDGFTCNNKMGDPIFGTKKKCYRTLIGPRGTETNYQRSAQEGALCTLNLPAGGNSFRRVRYGVGESWVYFWAGADFKCGNDFAGIDPKFGVKKECQMGVVVTSPASEWVDCGGEGQTCNLPEGGRPVLARYGTGNGWVMRTFAGKVLECSNRAFGYDPAYKKTKNCSYRKVTGTADDVKIVDVTGDWVRVWSCTGTGACAASLQYSVGTTSGKEHAKGSDWTTSLAITIGAEIQAGVEGISATVSQSVTAGVANTQTEQIVNSFTMAKSTSLTTTCDGQELWQWKTTVRETCGGTICSTEADSNILVCQKTANSKPAPLLK
jgi:hypothetical protein